jgi:hypothetical protein
MAVSGGAEEDVELVKPAPAPTSMSHNWISEVPDWFVEIVSMIPEPTTEGCQRVSIKSSTSLDDAIEVGLFGLRQAHKVKVSKSPLKNPKQNRRTFWKIRELDKSSAFPYMNPSPWYFLNLISTFSPPWSIYFPSSRKPISRTLLASSMTHPNKFVLLRYFFLLLCPSL